MWQVTLFDRKDKYIVISSDVHTNVDVSFTFIFAETLLKIAIKIGDHYLKFNENTRSIICTIFSQNS